ncbi:hypothetical protein E4U16_000950, partial [Claviceps sp. LM84 group G4]
GQQPATTGGPQVHNHRHDHSPQHLSSSYQHRQLKGKQPHHLSPQAPIRSSPWSCTSLPPFTRTLGKFESVRDIENERHTARRDALAQSHHEHPVKAPAKDELKNGTPEKIYAKYEFARTKWYEEKELPVHLRTNEAY